MKKLSMDYKINEKMNKTYDNTETVKMIAKKKAN